MESFQCGHHSFCNFDFHSSGYCESCISLEEGDCENMGLITNKGEQECQGICKGIWIMNAWNCVKFKIYPQS